MLVNSLKQDIIQIPQKRLHEQAGLASKQIMPRIMMTDFQWALNVYLLNALKKTALKH